VVHCSSITPAATRPSGLMRFLATPPVTSTRLNTATGYQALYSNIDGNGNTANGYNGLFGNTNGDGNTSHGYRALLANTTGSGNTAVGATALAANITGGDNIALGSTAGSNVISASNVICIGANGANVSFGCYIGQIYGNFTSGGAGVFISSDGKLATSPSSRRFKEEIKPMEQASEVLFALKPVTFRYKKGIDPQGIPQQPTDFETAIVQQRKATEALVARLNEQEARIQKVSAQVETSSPVRQILAENP